MTTTFALPDNDLFSDLVCAVEDKENIYSESWYGGYDEQGRFIESDEGKFYAKDYINESKYNEEGNKF
jgi:hypothetical protein